MIEFVLKWSAFRNSWKEKKNRKATEQNIWKLGNGIRNSFHQYPHATYRWGAMNLDKQCECFIWKIKAEVNRRYVGRASDWIPSRWLKLCIFHKMLCCVLKSQTFSMNINFMACNFYSNRGVIRSSCCRSSNACCGLKPWYRFERVWNAFSSLQTGMVFWRIPWYLNSVNTSLPWRSFCLAQNEK